MRHLALRDTESRAEVYIDERADNVVRVTIDVEVASSGNRYLWIDEYRGDYDKICLDIARKSGAEIMGVKAA